MWDTQMLLLWPLDEAIASGSGIVSTAATNNNRQTKSEAKRLIKE
jgi:hypothetical protein